MVLALSVGMGIRIAIGIAAMLLLWKIGLSMLRALSSTPLPPAEPGELRKVNVNYRCDICGVQLRMTLAPDEDPPAPNHCLEEMVLVAPAFE